MEVWYEEHDTAKFMPSYFRFSNQIFVLVCDRGPCEQTSITTVVHRPVDLLITSPEKEFYQENNLHDKAGDLFTTYQLHKR